MLSSSPSLADRFASLRAAAEAEPEGFWLTAAVHALIMACLARIFGRLEHLAQLWQSGQLPPPPPARPSIQPRATSANHTNRRGP